MQRIATISTMRHPSRTFRIGFRIQFLVPTLNMFSSTFWNQKRKKGLVPWGFKTATHKCPIWCFKRFMWPEVQRMLNWFNLRTFVSVNFTQWNQAVSEAVRDIYTIGARYKRMIKKINQGLTAYSGRTSSTRNNN